MSALVLDGATVRRDGEMLCMTDLWRAGGAPNGSRPANWLRKEGAAFLQFLEASESMPQGHTRKKKGNPGIGEPPTLWAHWRVALAYAMALSHPLHKRVLDEWHAMKSGQLRGAEVEIELSLRIKALNSTEYTSLWNAEMKGHLVRLYRLEWDGTGSEPVALKSAYGFTWEVILGKDVYRELKKRNPHPRDGSLHGQWLREERERLCRHVDFVRTLDVARRSTHWAEYIRELKATFERAPRQLNLPSNVRLLRPKKRAS